MVPLDAPSEACLPYETLAEISIVCVSALKSVHMAAQAIKCGNAEIIIVSGRENISRAEKAGWQRGDLDETFTTQSLAVNQRFGLDPLRLDILLELPVLGSWLL